MPAPPPVDQTLEAMRRKFKEWRETSSPSELMDMFPRLMAAVVRDEREACAKIAESVFPGDDVAAAIRARTD